MLPTAQNNMLLPTDQLRPGMQVVRDVVNDSGVLLVAGTLLNENILHRLQVWGIATVEVAGDASSPSQTETGPSIPSEVLRQAEELVNRRLMHVPLNKPGLLTLRELAVRRTAVRLGKGSKGHLHLPAQGQLPAASTP